MSYIHVEGVLKMVDSVKPQGPAQQQVPNNVSKNAPAIGSEVNAGTSQSVVPTPTESVSVSMSLKNTVRDMAEKPPMNLELVNEIRQRVADGNYPIDAAAISSRMLDSIRDG